MTSYPSFNHFTNFLNEIDHQKSNINLAKKALVDAKEDRDREVKEVKEKHKKTISKASGAIKREKNSYDKQIFSFLCDHPDWYENVDVFHIIEDNLQENIRKDKSRIREYFEGFFNHPLFAKVDGHLNYYDPAVFPLYITIDTTDADIQDFVQRYEPYFIAKLEADRARHNQDDTTVRVPSSSESFYMYGASFNYEIEVVNPGEYVAHTYYSQKSNRTSRYDRNKISQGSLYEVVLAIRQDLRKRFDN